MAKMSKKYFFSVLITPSLIHHTTKSQISLSKGSYNHSSYTLPIGFFNFFKILDIYYIFVVCMASKAALQITEDCVSDFSVPENIAIKMNKSELCLISLKQMERAIVWENKS